jgi:putative transcriptional regulator
MLQWRRGNAQLSLGGDLDMLDHRLIDLQPYGWVALQWRQVLAIVLGMALSAAVVSPIEAQTPSRTSLVGQLLVASPAMEDPRFRKTVIVVVRHDRDGAFGLVVNRPIGERPLADLLGGSGERGPAMQVRIFSGGPVQPEIGFVLHGGDYRRPETVDISAHVAMTASREILHDIANSTGPRQWLIAFGYSGWGPGQLESELQRGSWSIAPGDPKLIFEEGRDQVWDEAYSQRMQDL